MHCWKCGTELEDPSAGKLPFRAICDSCGYWLHCCKNCKHYRPGLPNDCAVPDTELITDREAVNFCEEFSLQGKGPSAAANPDAIAKKLFGEEEEAPPRSSFDDLFQ